jgi:hypothetical protein
MARIEQKARSRSLAMYALLLELYAPEFLARHRAEMLQNFEDLEHNLSSKTALWLLIGKDIMFSLISRNIPKSLWGQTDVHRARRFAGAYLSALLHGGRHGLLRIRDRMVCGMDGEAKASESIADMMLPAAPGRRAPAWINSIIYSRPNSLISGISIFAGSAASSRLGSGSSRTFSSTACKSCSCRG